MDPRILRFIEKPDEIIGNASAVCCTLVFRKDFDGAKWAQIHCILGESHVVYNTTYDVAHEVVAWLQETGKDLEAFKTYRDNDTHPNDVGHVWIVFDNLNSLQLMEWVALGFTHGIYCNIRRDELINSGRLDKLFKKP